MNEQALKDLMLRENEDFRKLYEEHQECEKRLEILQIKSVLSEGEKIEERELKKRKLALKDRMYLMMAEFQRRR
ncbi:MAG: YdcH family protein [Candidatus Aminicenantales bacterium]